MFGRPSADYFAGMALIGATQAHYTRTGAAPTNDEKAEIIRGVFSLGDDFAAEADRRHKLWIDDENAKRKAEREAADAEYEARKATLAKPARAKKKPAAKRQTRPAERQDSSDYSTGYRG